MQALILNDDRAAQAAMAMALFGRNFQVVTADDVEIATSYARLGVFDLVVMAERVRGRLSHSVALAAELRNPDVTTMLLTSRTDKDVDELFELLPSLYCLLGERLDPELVARMAVAGVVGKATAAERAQRAEAEAEAESGDWEEWPEEDWPEEEEAAAEAASGAGWDALAAGARYGQDGAEARMQAAAAARAAGELSPAMAEIIARATERLRLRQGGATEPLLLDAAAKVA